MRMRARGYNISFGWLAGGGGLVEVGLDQPELEVEVAQDAGQQVGGAEITGLPGFPDVAGDDFAGGGMELGEFFQ